MNDDDMKIYVPSASPRAEKPEDAAAEVRIYPSS